MRLFGFGWTRIPMTYDNSAICDGYQDLWIELMHKNDLWIFSDQFIQSLLQLSDFNQS